MAAKRKKAEQVDPALEVPTSKHEGLQIRKRDEYGLLIQPKVDYKFKEDGSIDWRAMVKSEYLYPNRQKTQETDITKLQDKDLLIKLYGLLDLAKLRGYRNIEFDTKNPTSSYCHSTCRINWRGNYETEGEDVVQESTADSHLCNEKSFMQNHLATSAENRSLGRAIRRFLGIDIVSWEEMGDNKEGKTGESSDSEASTSFGPYAALLGLMKKHNVSFKDVLKVLEKEGFPNVETIQSVEDIPARKVANLMGRIAAKFEKS